MQKPISKDVMRRGDRRATFQKIGCDHRHHADIDQVPAFCSWPCSDGGAVSDRDLRLAGTKFDRPRIGIEQDLDVRVTFAEFRQSRHQPASGKGRLDADFQIRRH
jgi:hypothetical protein